MNNELNNRWGILYCPRNGIKSKRKRWERLQKELDEMHPENVSDLRRLEIKIADSGMNETARKEAEILVNEDAELLLAEVKRMEELRAEDKPRYKYVGEAQPYLT